MIYRTALMLTAALLMSGTSTSSTTHAKTPTILPNVWFTTSPAGSAFYYDPASAHTSQDGKIGRIRIRIVHSENVPRIFKSQASSSTAVWVFVCAQRTYQPIDQHDYDPSGKPLPQREFPIELALPAQQVTVDVEPVYRAACAKR